MATNFPNGVSSQGVPVIPSIPLSTGTYFFVSSLVGSDSATGRDKQHPLATVQAAVNKCSAGKGDVILVMPGHAETISAATTLQVTISGVQIVGIGTGLLRPTFTFAVANTATITISAPNVSWTNCHFIANFLNVASAFTLGTTAKDFAINNCSFIDNSASLNFLCIVTTSATANSADGLAFTNNYVFGLAATDGAVISILCATARVQISDNVVDKAGVTSDAGHLVTLSTFATLGIRVLRNIVSMISLASQATGSLGTGSSTASSGMVADNYVAQIDTSTALLWTAGSKISFIQNFVSGAADKSGTIFPAADDPA